MSGGPVVEHVELSIHAGRGTDFEAAFEVGRRAIEQGDGFQWVRLVRQVEDPSRYLLLVGWDSLEAHTVGFRGSALFDEWRAAVGEFFVEPPVLVHYASWSSTDDGPDHGGAFDAVS